ncbi:LuxR family two component transcriptional regulator [Stackebrandtia endophytica]|uniref:LuxR family two component transcriptional regulator n=1 Tax=Stackebrandtia endophytica TaxID=1496996 RepID=A0A543AQ07_9ACTN|nr:response regulator transcription factor [Stackebrandtia endophytica]TQL74629.1 LuxR family two component transcriptional regulator [Stackebrandtia endophytica]
MIRVLLADDQPLMRGGFRALLNAEEDMEVVAEAADGDAAVELAAVHRPNVALLDVQMPGADGIAATARIAALPELSGVKVVMLTNYGFDEYVFEALRAGASGFLIKDIEPEELLRSVRVVAGGDALLAPQVTARLIAEFISRPLHREVGDDGLTGREREVVALVARGMSNQEIAAELVISPMTAKTHVSRAMVKLRCRDRAQLVVFAYESGLVVPRRVDS